MASPSRVRARLRPAAEPPDDGRIDRIILVAHVTICQKRAICFKTVVIRSPSAPIRTAATRPARPPGAWTGVYLCSMTHSTFYGSAPGGGPSGGSGSGSGATIGGVTEARVAAATICADMRGGDLLDPAFDRRTIGLDARDRRWTRELVYGMLRHRSRLDALLAARVNGGLARLDADLADLLRLGAQQLL